MFFVGVANGVRALAEGTTCVGDVLSVDMFVQLSQLFLFSFLDAFPSPKQQLTDDVLYKTRFEAGTTQTTYCKGHY